MSSTDTQVVTLLLERINRGDKSAEDELLPLVYDQLHGFAANLFARQGSDHTLQPTALVHEAYLKLLGQEDDRKQWDGRLHFYAVAATAMRRLLIDYARSANRINKGADKQVTLADASDSERGSSVEIEMLSLNAALEELEAVSARAARVVELRFFAGLTVEETARELGVVERVVYKDWRAARAMLMRRIQGGAED